MRFRVIAALLFSTSLIAFSQDNAQKIYDTERAFERAVAEKGINAAFIEFLSPLGVIFRPEPVNAREWWSSRPASPASLTWNPIKVEVSANGALGYSIGNSIYKPKGKSDTDEFHGHYISVWTRQPNGDYRAALDAGVDHAKPAVKEPNWTRSADATIEANPKNLFAGDSTIGFYRMAERRGLARAYKQYAADDIYLLRPGKEPFVGRSKAVDNAGSDKLNIKFAKRRSFIEAGDLAYVYSTYSLSDKSGAEKEKGNFVQVWKLREGHWRIVADLFIPVPAPKS